MRARVAGETSRPARCGTSDAARDLILARARVRPSEKSQCRGPILSPGYERHRCASYGPFKAKQQDPRGRTVNDHILGVKQ